MLVDHAPYVFLLAHVRGDVMYVQASIAELRGGLVQFFGPARRDRDAEAVFA